MHNVQEIIENTYDKTKNIYESIDDNCNVSETTLIKKDNIKNNIDDAKKALNQACKNMNAELDKIKKL